MNTSSLAEKNILVVDDDLNLREAIAFDLKKKGGHIFMAANGTEAFEIVKNENIDIVVSDVRMPNGDGIALIKKIRKRHPALPVVLLCTGFSDLTESEAKKLGAYGLIEKPIDRKAMIALLEQSVLKL